MFPHKFIEARLREAVKEVLPDAETTAVLVRPCPDPKFGDYQTNALMSLAKTRKLNPRQLAADAIGEMERLYKLIEAASKADAAILEHARNELVKLQGGDEENLRIWREMIAFSQTQFDTIYQRLGVRFDYTYGESFYHPR